MPPYATQFQLATDSAFLQRVEMAMLDYCNDVQNEADSVVGHAQRKGAAQRAIGNSGFASQQVGKVICGVYPTMIETVSDTQLKQAIAGVWNLFSGV